VHARLAQMTEIGRRRRMALDRPTDRPRRSPA
jgi:hypothetical protein